MKIYFPIMFVLMAAFFLFIGLKVVLGKKPVFMPSRYFFAFMLLAFSPQFINTANLFTQTLPGNVGHLLLLTPIMFIFLLIFLWFQMKGYMAIGVSDDSFRDALLYSLNTNGLPFEEQLSAIKLTSIDATLQVAIQSWIGAGQIKLKKSKDSKVLPRIIAEINTYYVENDVKPNNITSVFYIIMGIFMLVFAGAFYFIHP